MPDTKTVYCPDCDHTEDVPTTHSEITCSECGTDYRVLSSPDHSRGGT